MNDRLTKLIEALNKEEIIIETGLSYHKLAIQDIKTNANNPKKSVVDCYYPSIVSAISKSAELHIPIDNRGFAYLEPRYDKNLNRKVCGLGIGYKAYFYKLSAILDGFDGEAFCIYEGDEITTEDKDGFHSYTLKRKDLFASGPDKMKGVIVRLSYFVGGLPRQKLGFVGMDEINKIKSKAKTKMIWNEWFDEKAKVAATRRACKNLFDISQGLQDLNDYDNKNYELKKKEPEEVADIIDNVVPTSKYITEDQVGEIRALIFESGTDEDMILEWIGANAIEEIKSSDYEITKEAISEHTAEFIKDLV